MGVWSSQPLMEQIDEKIDTLLLTLLCSIGTIVLLPNYINVTYHHAEGMLMCERTRVSCS